MHPSADAIHAQLGRIVASPQFAGSPRMSRFLRFVVERTLAGDGERLKEYVIGVEVFDRGADYDPRVDSIVRVEAGRLRGKLDEYYRGAGSADGVRITLEKGSYVPHFGQWQVDTQKPAATAARSHGRKIAVAATVGVVTLVLVVVLMRDRTPEQAATAAGSSVPPAAAFFATNAPVGAGPVIAVLPFVPYGEDAAATTLGARLTEGLTAELVRTGRFKVVPSARVARFRDPAAIPDDIGKLLGAEFLLRGRLILEGDRLRVEAVLMDGALSRKPWANSFSGGMHDLDDLQRRIAQEAGEAIGQRSASIE